MDDELAALFPNLVSPFARGVLGRLDLLSSLAAQDADEAPHGVRLPARGFHDLGQRHAFGAFYHGDDVGLLVAAIGLWFSRWLLGPPRLLRGLGLLGRRALALGFRRIGAGLLMFSLSIALSLIEFSLTGLGSSH